MFVPGKFFFSRKANKNKRARSLDIFQPSHLILVSKLGACPSGAPRGRSYKIILDFFYLLFCKIDLFRDLREKYFGNKIG